MRGGLLGAIGAGAVALASVGAFVWSDKVAGDLRGGDRKVSASMEYSKDVFGLTLNRFGMAVPPGVQAGEKVFTYFNNSYGFSVFGQEYRVRSSCSSDGREGSRGKMDADILICTTNYDSGSVGVSDFGSFLITSRPVSGIRRVSRSSGLKFSGDKVSLVESTEVGDAAVQATDPYTRSLLEDIKRGHPVLNRAFIEGDPRVYRVPGIRGSLEKKSTGVWRWNFRSEFNLNFEYNDVPGLEIAIVNRIGLTDSSSGRSESRTFYAARQYSPPVIPELTGDWEVNNSIDSLESRDVVRFIPGRSITFFRPGDGEIDYAREFLRKKNTIVIIDPNFKRKDMHFEINDDNGQTGLTVVSPAGKAETTKVR